MRRRFRRSVDRRTGFDSQNAALLEKDCGILLRVLGNTSVNMGRPDRPNLPVDEPGDSSTST